MWRGSRSACAGGRRFPGFNVPRNHPLTQTLSHWERAAKGIHVSGNHRSVMVAPACPRAIVTPVFHDRGPWVRLPDESEACGRMSESGAKRCLAPEQRTDGTSRKAVTAMDCEFALVSKMLARAFLHWPHNGRLKRLPWFSMARFGEIMPWPINNLLGCHNVASFFAVSISSEEVLEPALHGSVIFMQPNVRPAVLLLQ